MSHRISIAIAILAGSLIACDAPHEAVLDPAVEVAALEGDLFTIQGDLRFASCSTGSPYYRRVAGAGDFRARALQTPTCDGLVGPDLTACQQFVWPSGIPLAATPALLHGGTAAGDEGYTIEAQRVFTDTADIEHPITWRLTNDDVISRGPRFNLGTSSNAPRLFFWGNVLRQVTAPAITGGVVAQDYVADQMASMRINVVYTPTQNVASDRIAVVSVNVLAMGSDSSSVARYTLRFTDGAFVADTVAPLDPDYPRTQDDALERPAVFGVSPQRLRLELPVPPAVGADADLTYSLLVNVQFGDGVRLSQAFPFQTDVGVTTVAPCAVLTQTLTIVRPDTRVRGTIFFRPDGTYPGPDGTQPGDPGHLSPYPVAYAPEIRNTGTGVLQPSTVTGDYVFNAWSTPNAPFPFSWSGVEPGSYRIDNVNANVGGRSVPRPHVHVTYPGKNELTYPDTAGTYRPMLRFPMRDASSPDDDFAVTVGTPLALRIGSSDDLGAPSADGDMAFLQGTLELRNLCPTPLPFLRAGAVEIAGASSRGVDASTRGLARGLFMQGTSGYEVAALGGGWIESLYRLQLKDAQYDGMLTIDPAVDQTWTLTPGYANRVTATPREYMASSLQVLFRLSGGAPFKNARVEVYRDVSASALGPFFDTGAPTQLGRYHALSRSTDGTVRTEQALPIIGLPTGGACTLDSDCGSPGGDCDDTTLRCVVSFQASAEVQTACDDDLDCGGTGGPCVQGRCTDRWALTSFPPFKAPMDACCAFVTLDGTSYSDDGVGPLLSNLTASQPVPTETTTFTLTGTLEDQVPITAVILNGVEYPVSSVSNLADPPTFTADFSVEVELPVEGANTFQISSRGCNLGQGTIVTITRAVDLCADLVYEQCIEEEPGSVFSVDVIRPNDGAVCQVQCSTAGPGAPIACATTPICPL